MYNSDAGKRENRKRCVIRQHIMMYMVTIVFGFGIIRTGDAWVDHSTGKVFEKKYEGRIYFLRTNLVTYEPSDRRPDFETDMQGFIYPTDEEGEGTVAFAKGEKIIIEDFDIDLKDVEISFRSFESGKRGRVRFVFGHRLSRDFTERTVFAMRFDEIFMQEELKETPEFSDTITNHIRNGDIVIGMSKDELILTLGQPFDIVTHVGARRMEVWYYAERGRNFRFYFTDDLLTRWIEY